MNKKRKDEYLNSIEDVALEISINRLWCEAILNLNYSEKLFINGRSQIELPKYIKDDIIDNNFKYYVEKVKECDEEFAYWRSTLESYGKRRSY